MSSSNALWFILRLSRNRPSDPVYVNTGIGRSKSAQSRAGGRLQIALDLSAVFLLDKRSYKFVQSVENGTGGLQLSGISTDAVPTWPQACQHDTR